LKYHTRKIFLTKKSVMKNLCQKATWKHFAALVIFSFIQIISIAQDQNGDNSTSSSTTTRTTTTQSTEWYTAPWVWIVGGAVLILLLVAILSGGRGSSRSSVTRTTSHDTGTGTVTTVSRDSDEV
jgi:hypothetical protein